MLTPQLMLTIKNRASKCIAFFAVVVALFTACGPPGARALFAGKRLLDQGKYVQAIAKLKTATTLLSTNALAYSYLGLACHQAGQSPQAESAYQQALALDPDLVEVRYNLGCLWLSENKLEPAKNTLTAFTLRRPGSAEGWLRLGTAQLRSALVAPAYLRAGELAAAERSFNESLRLGLQSPEALTGLGLARLQRNRATEAAQYFSRALKQQPDFRPALLNLAIVAQEDLHDRPLALQKYREYLALKPVPDNAGDVRAIVRQLEEELAPPLPRSVVAERESQQAPNKSPEPVRNVASSKTVTNVAHVPVAPPPSASIAAALKPSPTNTPKPAPSGSPPGPVQIAQVPAEPVLKPAQDVPAPAPTTEPAVSPASTARQPSTKEPRRGFLHKLNPLGLLGGEPKSPSPTTPLPTQSQGPGTPLTEASAAVDMPRPVSPRYIYKSPAKPPTGNRSEAEKIFAQGVQAQKSQHLTEAQQAYRRALQADPSFYDAWYNLGLAATESGDLPAALTAYENALALRVDSLDARYNFALTLKQANYPIDAARELEKILVRYPNDSRAHLALGNLYAQQLDQPEKARAQYVKVLEMDPRNPQAGAIRYWLTDTSR